MVWEFFKKAILSIRYHNVGWLVSCII